MDSTDIRVLITVLLPMVPAFLLFKFLPSKAVVKGPLKGWNLNLRGAFGGYFAVFVLLFFNYPDPPELPGAEVWEVRGQVDFEPENAGAYQTLSIRQVPVLQNTRSDGVFTIRIARLPNFNGQLAFPDLIFNHDQYFESTVSLEEVGEKDPVRRRISLSDLGVVLRAKGEHQPPYSPSDEPLQPLPE